MRICTLTSMIPANAYKYTHSSVNQPLGIYLMSSLIHSLHCVWLWPCFCSATHLWDAKIMGATLSSIWVWWIAPADFFVCARWSFYLLCIWRPGSTCCCRMSMEIFLWTTPQRGLKAAGSSENIWRKMVKTCTPLSDLPIVILCLDHNRGKLIFT